MNFYGERKTVLASTNGISYEFYVSGCNNGKGYCKGCHSEHTWYSNFGIPMTKEWYDNKIVEMKNRGEFKFDNINLLGGEPLDSSETDIRYFCDRFRQDFPSKGFWLYTHFTEEDIKEKFIFVYELFDYIKVGKFDINKLSDYHKSNDIYLSSTNQYIIKTKGQSCY